MKKSFLPILFLMLMLPSPLFVHMLAAQDDVLHVDTTQDLGPISPYVYGANFVVTPPDLMQTVQALGLKFLRLGGNRADQINVDHLSIDLIVSQAHQMGAEPDITVRLLNGTPKDAAAAVHYANIEKGYKVRFWSIGNEPNFFVAVQHASSYTTEDLNRNWRAIAEAMLAVDPSIVLLGPDISQYVVLDATPGNIQYLEGSGGGDPTDDLGKDWLQEFLRVNGDLVGIVSIHRYPYPGAGGSGTATATIDGLRANSREWDTIIPNLRKIIRQSAGRDIPIAVTEFNSNSTPSSGGAAGLDSFYNGIWVADVLGRLIRNQVEAAAYWDLRNKDNGFGLIGNADLRPSYYAYIMYTHFGTELLKTDWTDQDVSIYAAKRDDGTLTLMVVNLGPDEKTKTLKLDAFTANGNAEVWRFDADHKAEQIDSQAITDGSTITVPGQSVTLYAVPG